MAVAMEFCLLGPLTVRVDGAAVPIPSGKQRALLTALLLHAGHAHHHWQQALALYRISVLRQAPRPAP